MHLTEERVPAIASLDTVHEDDFICWNHEGIRGLKNAFSVHVGRLSLHCSFIQIAEKKADVSESQRLGGAAYRANTLRK